MQDMVKRVDERDFQYKQIDSFVTGLEKRYETKLDGTVGKLESTVKEQLELIDVLNEKTSINSDAVKDLHSQV